MIMYKKHIFLLGATVVLGTTVFMSRAFGANMMASEDVAQVQGVAIEETGTTTVALSWEEVDGADKYKVRLMDADGETLRTKKTKETQKELKKLEPDTTYLLKVRAIVDGAKGPWSEEIEYTTDTDTGTVISITDFMFDPDSVEITAGDSVTWVNNDSTSHTVTSDDEAFDSGTIAPGETFALDFSTAGVFPYHCDFHTAMKGTVIVK